MKSLTTFSQIAPLYLAERVVTKHYALPLTVRYGSIDIGGSLREI